MFKILKIIDNIHVLHIKCTYNVYYTSFDIFIQFTIRLLLMIILIMKNPKSVFMKNSLKEE